MKNQDTKSLDPITSPVQTPIPSVSPVYPISRPKNHRIIWVVAGAVILTIGMSIGLVLGKYLPKLKQISSYDDCIKAKGSRVQESNPPTCVTANGLSFKGQASSPTLTPDLTAIWKTYTNAKFGYEFKYPNNLYIYEFPNENLGVALNTIQITSENLPLDGPAGPILIDLNECKSLTSGQKYPCTEFVKDTITAKKTGLVKETLLVNNQFQVDGKIGTKISGVIAKGEISTSGQYINEIFIPLEANTLQFTLYGKTQEVVFDQILSTFKFLGEKLKYTCPENGWVDCMPILDAEGQKRCNPEAMGWYEANCPNFKGGAY